MRSRWPVISLDAGGTLLEPWPSVGQVYADCARELGFDGLDVAVIERQFRETWRECQPAGFDYSLAAWRRVVAGSFHGLVPEPASPALFTLAYERFAKPDVWRVYEDVVPSLFALRAAGVRLVVTSNWDQRLRPLLERLGLASFFDHVAVSVEYGFHKPDGRFFGAVAARMGVGTAEMLHVGDGEREDYRGARASGCAALWLRRSLDSDSRKLPATGEIGSLSAVILALATGPCD